MVASEQIMIVDSTHPEEEVPEVRIERNGEVVKIGEGTRIIEVANVGPIKKGEDGRWYPIEARMGIDPIRVPYEYCSCKKYHGYQWYEYITDKQITSLRTVLVRMLRENGIKFPYDNQLGTVCRRAQGGGSGVYFASSYDKHRHDIHPQIDLIKLIKSLAS